MLLLFCLLNRPLLTNIFKWHYVRCVYSWFCLQGTKKFNEFILQGFFCPHFFFFTFFTELVFLQLQMCLSKLFVCVCVCSWAAALLRAACADGSWWQTNWSFPHKPQPQLPADLDSPHSWSKSYPFPPLPLTLCGFNETSACCFWCVGEHSAIWMAPCPLPASGLARLHEPSFPRCPTGLCFWQLMDI